MKEQLRKHNLRAVSRVIATAVWTSAKCLIYVILHYLRRHTIRNILLQVQQQHHASAAL